MSVKSTSITLKLPGDKRKELNALAVKTGISVAGIVRSLIYTKLDQEQKES